MKKHPKNIDTRIHVRTKYKNATDPDGKGLDPNRSINTFFQKVRCLPFFTKTHLLKKHPPAKTKILF